MPQRLVLASGNPGKLREFGALLGPLGFELLAQHELGIADALEPWPSFVENAIAKARHASRESGLPALADDSGLCVRSLAGAPGVHSARFAQIATGAGGDRANIEYLLASLANQSDRSAHFHCVLVFLRHPDDPQPFIAQGSWAGRILEAPVGDGGFGYDPVFQPNGECCSAAELSAFQKNAVSHRGRASRMLLEQLRAANGAHALTTDD